MKEHSTLTGIPVILGIQQRDGDYQSAYPFAGNTYAVRGIMEEMKEMKFVGYSDGTETNPDGTKMCQGSEIFLFKGEAWEGYRLMELGLIPSPDGVAHHPVEGWFNT